MMLWETELVQEDFNSCDHKAGFPDMGKGCPPLLNFKLFSSVQFLSRCAHLING